MNRYCIWLTIDSIRLRKIILNLAQKYHGPIFQPHLTLIGRTNVSLNILKSATYSFANDFNLSNVQGINTNFTNEYFQSYYIEIKEKQILTQLHKTMCESLNINCDKNYLPHISLMYNNISKEEKEQIILPFDYDKPFDFRSIQITDCDGEVENWKPIFEFNI